MTDLTIYADKNPSSEMLVKQIEAMEMMLPSSGDDIMTTSSNLISVKKMIALTAGLIAARQARKNAIDRLAEFRGEDSEEGRRVRDTAYTMCAYMSGAGIKDPDGTSGDPVLDGLVRYALRVARAQTRWPV